MEKLVNMAKRGDTEAFTQLMQSQMQNMYKTARSILSQDEDVDGNIIDPDEPSTGNILELMNDPVLTHKGNWTAWLGALIISIFNAFSILYADEIFRWNLAFQIRDTDGAEPSDWEIAGTIR